MVATIRVLAQNNRQSVTVTLLNKNKSIILIFPGLRMWEIPLKAFLWMCFCGCLFVFSFCVFNFICCRFTRSVSNVCDVGSFWLFVRMCESKCAVVLTFGAETLCGVHVLMSTVLLQPSSPFALSFYFILLKTIRWRLTLCVHSQVCQCRRNSSTIFNIYCNSEWIHCALKY